MNANNFNQQPLWIASQQYPMSYDSILKAPANFRDSALYSNDPSDPMFAYHVAQHIADGDGFVQPISAIDQRQHPQSYLNQPNYINIPGKPN